MATHSSILAWRNPHGQRNLVGYSSWGHKELDMTEVTYHTHMLMGESGISNNALKTLRGVVSSAFGMVIDRKVSPEEVTFESQKCEHGDQSSGQ